MVKYFIVALGDCVVSWKRSASLVDKVVEIYSCVLGCSQTGRGGRGMPNVA